MTAIEIINQIEADKKARNIEPTHATLREIEDIAIERENLQSIRDVRDELNQLWIDKKIRIGDTINGNYIKLLK